MENDPTSDELVPAVADPTPVSEGQLPVPAQSPFYRAVNRARYQRQDLINEIQRATGRKLVCYVSETAAVTRDDVVPLMDTLHRVEVGSSVDFLLHTSGGDVDAADKIVRLLQRRVGGAKPPRSPKKVDRRECVATSDPHATHGVDDVLARSRRQVHNPDRNRLRDVAQVLLPLEVAEPSQSLGGALDGVGDKQLARFRNRRDSSGNVDGRPIEVTLVLDRRAVMRPRSQPWELMLGLGR